MTLILSMDAFTVATLHDQIKKLSPRQMEIVRLLVQGNNAPQIATILSISPGTVKTHINIACRKLNVNSRIRLIVIFVQWQTMQELNNGDLHRTNQE